MGNVVNALYPGFPSGKFVKLIKNQEGILVTPSLLEDILTILVVIPIKVPPEREFAFKDCLGDCGLTHLARAPHKHHLLPQIFQEIRIEVPHMAILF